MALAAGCGDGLGTVRWWGLSPALDLQEFCADAEPEPAPDGRPEVAALLVGAAEGRHLLRTMARAARWPLRALTLYVAEERPEVVARQLLFLALAAEPRGRLGLQGRSRPPRDPPGARERDALEAVLRRWQRPEPGAFPLRRLWERRLRRHLGARYDSRAAVADWELRMGLHERGLRMGLHERGVRGGAPDGGGTGPGGGPAGSCAWGCTSGG
ncbi:dynein axonemal assembly factor 3-like [Struthio camelus]|uniref:dynein axonemal assembly factor 3-like n=1 Tax=Struthio camelus TaxID=8801 RepID=UPI00360413EC